MTAETIAEYWRNEEGTVVKRRFPKSHRIHLRVGEMCTIEGRGLKHAGMVVSVHPSNPEHWFNFAILYSGHTGQAFKELTLRREKLVVIQINVWSWIIKEIVERDERECIESGYKRLKLLEAI